MIATFDNYLKTTRMSLKNTQCIFKQENVVFVIHAASEGSDIAGGGGGSAITYRYLNPHESSKKAFTVYINLHSNQLIDL